MFDYERMCNYALMHIKHGDGVFRKDFLFEFFKLAGVQPDARIKKDNIAVLTATEVHALVAKIMLNQAHELSILTNAYISTILEYEKWLKEVNKKREQAK